MDGPRVRTEVNEWNQQPVGVKAATLKHELMYFLDYKNADGSAAIYTLYKLRFGHTSGLYLCVCECVCTNIVSQK